ncbi:MAG: hypothetical protein ACI97A_003112 [Planctomycetota bacterium]|jgi:uncharacterized protein YdiU (UPF0061 family)
MPLTNIYRSLGPDFSEDVSPTPAPAPALLLWNKELAEELGIDSLIDLDQEELGRIFAGNSKLPGSEPIALAYAGHQFGHFSPQLGDGRAHLLGEITDKNGHLVDIQLKGSGPSRFSRRGDGRCGLSPAVREFIMSEAMHALRVPTTRSLAVVTTGEVVYRQEEELGAVVTRVASSHLRVGTFEYFAARKNNNAIEALCEFAVKRHGPPTEKKGAELALHLLDSVIERQIRLVTAWMRVGFIHGVMNTDNTAVSGETLDYGPCAMMGTYDPMTVYSSVDRQSRYAFGNQFGIMQWNMARLAECLIPLIHEDQDEAIEIATVIVRGIAARLETSRLTMMGQKLGLATQEPDDATLINKLLAKLEEEKLDYTDAFNRLTKSRKDKDVLEELTKSLGDEWINAWHERLLLEENDVESTFELMRKTNPVVIPRNHHVEEALSRIGSNLDKESIADFMSVLRSPYEETEKTALFQDPPSDGDCHYQTFCGT